MTSEEIAARAAQNGLVTIRLAEVAKKANVSRSTVRNCIHHPSIVAAATRRRVLMAIGFREDEIQRTDG